MTGRQIAPRQIQIQRNAPASSSLSPDAALGMRISRLVVPLRRGYRRAHWEPHGFSLTLTSVGSPVADQRYAVGRGPGVLTGHAVMDESVLPCP